MTARTPRKTADAGFTLLEMLVVMAILALALAVVAPWPSRARAGLDLRATALEMASDLRVARAAARSSNNVQALVFDATGRHYAVHGLVPPRALSNALAVELTVPDLERGEGTLGRLRFFPDGSTTGGKIRLTDGRRTTSISVDWLNGDIRVAEGR